MNRKDLETIQAVQSDTLREIAFEFYATDAEEAMQLDPDEFTVKFNMLKPDNNFVMTTFTDGVIKLSDQMTAVTGTGYYCILLMQDDEVIYSGNGKIIINDHVIGSENIDSVSEADGLVFPDDFYTRDTPIAEIDDTTTSDSSTWSSEKIAEEIAAGSGADLIDDTVTSTTKTWSSNKISAEVAAKTSINDNGITTTETWSSDKIETELNGKPDVDDTAQNYVDTWSSQKINDEIDEAGRIDDVRTSDETTWSSEKIANEISSITPGGAAYSTVEHSIGTWIDSSPVYERTINLGSFSVGSGGDHTIETATSINLLIDYDGYVVESGIMYALPDPSIRIKIDSNKDLIFNGAASWDISSGYITIRYTKVANA